MLPGFTGLSTAPVHGAGPSANAAVRLALWDTPSPERCRYARTITKCTGVVLWCTEVFVCVNGSEERKTPYPCGGCIGFDW